MFERRRRRAVEANLRLRVAEVFHLNRSATAGALSASIAHELKQPLAAIMASAEAAELYLNANQPDLERVKTIFGNIRGDDQHAADIISHLRGLLKQKSENELQEFDLDDAVDDAVKFIGPAAIKKGVALNTNYAKGVLLVRADRVQFEQVMMNLAINAMDAMENRDQGARRLSIKTTLNGGSEAKVSVSDSGTAYPPTS